MMERSYRIVEDHEEDARARALPARGGLATGVTVALLAGQTLFFPGKRASAISGWSTHLKKRGYRINIRSTPEGAYVWAMRIEPCNSPDSGSAFGP